MPLTINSNIASLNAQRRLGESTSALQTSFQRLSSGLRINKASDDAAGLAISSGLQVDSRIASQGVRNANDGMSALSIAEGALEQLSSIGIRMEELAEQASNGIYSAAQRGALDKEAQALSTEFSRIIGTTSFNGLSLLGSSATTISIQVGRDKSAASQINVTINAPAQTTVGTGMFSAGNVIHTTFQTSNILTADLNKDGKLDAVYFNSSGATSVILGNGDGTFKSDGGANYDFQGSGNNRSKLVDINGDGNLDLVGILRTDNTFATISLGNGDGTFKAHLASVIIPASGDTADIETADLNGDGKLDLIATDQTDNLVGIEFGNGDGTFNAHVDLASSATNMFQTTVGDVNGDHILDIVVSGGQVFLGNGNGTFKLGAALNTEARSPVLIDFNNDGILDLAATESDHDLGVSFGVGDGTFKAEVTYQTAQQQFEQMHLAAADFNGDGIADLTVAATVDGVVDVLLNNGNGTFKAAVSYAVPGGAEPISIGDANGDGVSDIITGDYSTGSLTVLLGNSTVQGGLPHVSLLTQQGALMALDGLRSAVASISAAAETIGAGQSRLTTAISNLLVSRENFSAAASRIADVDVAEESAQLSRNTILQQAGAAVLGQANQQPALALQLLRNL